MNIINYIKGSFDTHSKSASARKLSAFWFVILVTILELSWLFFAFIKSDFSLFFEILALDIGFIATALGMTTYETIKKNAKNNCTDNTDNAI